MWIGLWNYAQKNCLWCIFILWHRTASPRWQRVLSLDQGNRYRLTAGLTTRRAGGPPNHRRGAGRTRTILYHTHIQLRSPCVRITTVRLFQPLYVNQCKENRTKPKKIKCAFCPNWFVPKNKTQKYCSKECYKKEKHIRENNWYHKDDPHDRTCE